MLGHANIPITFTRLPFARVSPGTSFDGRYGVKDFDVLTFYAAYPDATYISRRMVQRDSVGNDKDPASAGPRSSSGGRI